MRSRLASLRRGAGAALLLLLALTCSAPAQTIPTPEVIAPAEGESWEIDSNRNVRWASLPGTNVQVELSRDDGVTFEILFGNMPNDGTQFWNVTGPASPNCRLRIHSLDEPGVEALGGRFAIIEPLSTLTVTAPNGGESWTAGTLRLITWRAPAGGQVRIELSLDGGSLYQTLFGSTANDGEEMWTVPEQYTTDARIRITHLDDPALTDISDGDFEIARPPGIQVTTPSGGELWEIGTRREIRWEGTLGGGARIELSRDAGTTWETLFSNTPNDGAAEWQVEGPVAAACRIRVTRLDEIDGVTLLGASAADFGIVEHVTGVALTRPNGGDILIVGTQQLITWNAPAGGSVRIELSHDEGVSWETLFGSTPNDGAQVWTVGGPISPSCLVRLTTLDNGASDVSDATFFVTATPGLTVGSPNGCEVWTLGSVQTLFWSGLEGGRVQIELSRDAGVSWETLFESTPNDGAAPWVASGIPTKHALLRVTRLSVPLVSDVSDAVFEINGSPLAVSTPKDGDTWAIGAQQLIQWSSLPVGQVRIDVSRDAGDTWAPIFPATANDGGQFWIVEGPPTDAAVVRVTALGDAPGFGFSDGLFRIVRGTLVLSVPNGGEQWAIGTPKAISWSSTTAGSVRIELSRDGGGSWEPVFLNTPNDGNEVWTVTGPSCVDCRLRITSWQDETLQDATDRPFSVVCALSTATILPGQELNDVLATVDCQAPHRPGTKGKLYTFDMPKTGLVSIDVRSAGLRGHLYLIAPDGHLVADAGDLIDSVELPAGGPYTIEVASETAGVTGAFTLRLQLFDVTLLSPTGGEPWKLGEYQVITWYSPAPGVPADVRIVRAAEGEPGEAIAVGTRNDGVESWRVTAPASDHAVVRVCIPYGSRGTQICDQSSPFILAPCSGGETRACYSGSPGTLGIGDCRRGLQRCASDGVLGICEGEVLPTTDVCGDGHDQDCQGGDTQCRACAPDATCSDGDACTTDSCHDGTCQNALPEPLPLFDCRANALDHALSSILTGCDGTSHGVLRGRQAQRLARMLVKIQRLIKKAGAATTRRRCVGHVTRARKTGMALKAILERNTARGVICDPVASIIQANLSGLGEALVAVSSCAGKS